MHMASMVSKGRTVSKVHVCVRTASGGRVYVHVHVRVTQGTHWYVWYDMY